MSPPLMTTPGPAKSTPSSQVHAEAPLHLYRVSSPGIARVLSNQRLTPSACDDVRHIVLDLSGLNPLQRRSPSESSAG